MTPKATEPHTALRGDSTTTPTIAEGINYDLAEAYLEQTLTQSLASRQGVSYCGELENARDTGLRTTLASTYTTALLDEYVVTRDYQCVSYPDSTTQTVDTLSLEVHDATHSSSSTLDHPSKHHTWLKIETTTSSPEEYRRQANPSPAACSSGTLQSDNYDSRLRSAQCTAVSTPNPCA